MTKTEKYERVHYITNRPFSEELRRLIDDPPLGSVPMEITPAMATEMLKRNVGNRRISLATWNMWGKLMKAGKWLHTGESIIFGKGGRLLQGQHRLLGCVNYDSKFMVDVIFGRDNEIFSVLDTGKKRTCGDIFQIAGIKNNTILAAALVWIIGYDRGGFSKPTGGSPEYRMSNADILREYDNHTDLQDSVWVGNLFAKKRLTSPSLMLALHYICARKSRRDAKTFFKMLSSGAGAQKATDPALVLREKLIQNLNRPEKLSLRAIGALTINAWNLYRDGHSGRSLRFDSEKAFPRAR